MINKLSNKNKIILFLSLLLSSMLTLAVKLVIEHHFFASNFGFILRMNVFIFIVLMILLRFFDLNFFINKYKLNTFQEYLIIFFLIGLYPLHFFVQINLILTISAIFFILFFYNFILKEINFKFEINLIRIVRNFLSIFFILFFSYQFISPVFLSAEGSNNDESLFYFVDENLKNSEQLRNLDFIKVDGRFVYSQDSFCSSLHIKSIECHPKNIFYEILANEYKLSINNKDVNKWDFLYFIFPKKFINDYRAFVSYSHINSNTALHFNTITYYLEHFNLDQFKSNQYGFGPLSLTFLLKNSFNLDNYQSVIFTTTISIIIFFIIFGFFNLFGDEKYNFIIFCSYIISIFSVLFSSGYLAPFLYPIRYLPSLLLCVYLINRQMNRKNYNVFILLFFSVLIAVYNFEYALFTLLAILISGFIYKKIDAVLISIFSIVFSFYFYKYQALENLFLPSYLYYFSDLIQLGRNNIIVIGFTLLSFLSIYFLVISRKINFLILSVILFFIFSYFKIIWINSHNHISSLLLIYGILFCIFLHLKPNYNKNLFRNNMYIKAEKLIINVNYLFLVFLVLYYSTSFFLYPKNFFKKYSFLNYTSSNNFTYLSDLNREVIEEFSSIYRDDYFLLSESDSLISIITESKPTGLLYDFSTNSNHIFNSKSYPEFLDYLNSNFSKFIIDKSYIDRDKIYYKFLHDDVFNYLSFKKENTDNLIRELNIHRCETTRFFYIYCK